jgi:hypothetical protein
VAPGAATTVNTGAYVRVLFAGAEPALLFDTSRMVDAASQVYWRIDEGPLTKVTLTPFTPPRQQRVQGLRGGGGGGGGSGGGGAAAAGPNGTLTVLQATYGFIVTPRSQAT